MNGLILVLSLICGAASIGAAVCAVLILRLLREIKAPPHGTGEAGSGGAYTSRKAWNRALTT